MLRVVLLASGAGGDAASYRPEQDETQWWNRRDALVRCVNVLRPGIELVLLFDQDWTRIYLTCDGPYRSTEKAVIALWKQAAKAPGKLVQANGLQCRLVLGPSTVSLGVSMSSKREVLDYLQENCDLDFLRKHHLNSSTTAILKKTSRTKLLEIKKIHDATTARPKKRTKTTEGPLEQVLGELIPKGAVVVTLHESSSHELPVWDGSFEEETRRTTQSYVLFLGAVRDMVDSEYKALESFGQVVKVRLGPVAEFTSKILTVVAFHQQAGRLEVALDRLRHDAATSSPSASITLHTTELKFICLVPMNFNSVSLDLERRQGEPSLWKLVRVVVTALWRSKLAGSTHSQKSPSCSLDLLFQDRFVELRQDTVMKMAGQHRAAPSEYQILSMIREQPQQEFKCKSYVSRHRRYTIVDFGLRGPGERSESRSFYDTVDLKASSVACIVPIDEASDLRHKLRKYATRKKIRCQQGFDVPSFDREATIITTVQHLAYQGRLGTRRQCSSVCD